ncbi:hypothetical protein KR026_008962 [Drosophila bipectinata]|nr:hypothetical protein KR026_008962 [Drosophila bipectinata]
MLSSVTARRIPVTNTSQLVELESRHCSENQSHKTTATDHLSHTRQTHRNRNHQHRFRFRFDIIAIDIVLDLDFGFDLKFEFESRKARNEPMMGLPRKRKQESQSEIGKSINSHISIL